MAATTIEAPQYSFVQLKDEVSIAGCLTERKDCLPLNNLGNIKFQMFATVLSPPPAVAFPERIVFAYPVPEDDSCANADDIPDLGTLTPLIGRQESDSGYDLFDFDILMEENFDNIPLVGRDPIQLDECFKFKIVEIWVSALDPTTPVAVDVLGCTNCFYRIGELDLCYFSAVEYSNNENAYGFNYGDDFENLVLLELYLKNPQNPSEEASYQKSDGQYIKLSERIEEVYDLKTAYWRHEWHRKLKIALSHDNVNISNFNIGQQAFPLPDSTFLTQLSIDVVNKDPYTIEWDEAIDRLFAQANTKVKLSAPVSLYNTNCQ